MPNPAADLSPTFRPAGLGRRSRLRERARLDADAAPASRRELLLAATLLTALCALLYGKFAAQGGFLTDDWSLTRIATMPDVSGPFGAVRYLFDIGHRPLVSLYVPLVYGSLTDHETLHAILALTFAVLACTSLYALLRRRAHLPAVHALAISALCLAYPFSDAVRFWSAASHASLALALFLLGVIVALRALEREGARAAWLHAGSLALLAGSVFLYEVALPFLFVTLLVYLPAPRRRAVARWLADVALGTVAVLSIALADSQRSASDTGAGAMWAHGKQVYDAAVTVVARSLEPWGSPPRMAVLAVVFVVAAWAILTLALRRGDPTTLPRLRPWLAVAGAGPVVVLLGYAIYVPGSADQYYPLGVGLYNRVNLVPGIGMVLLGYGLAACAGVLLAGSSRKGALAALPLVAFIGVAFTGYVRLVADHADNWLRSNELQHGVIDFVTSRIPHPPANAAIYVRNTIFAAGGLPVFGADWDLSSALKLRYDRRDLTAYPIIPGMTLACSPAGVLPADMPAGWSAGSPAPFGAVFVVTPRDGTVVRIDSLAGCRRNRDLRGGPWI